MPLKLHSIRRSYALALGLVLSVCVGRTVGLREVLAEDAASGALINDAGRQRMLSQRAAKAAYAHRLEGSAATRRALEVAAAELTDGHRRLEGAVAGHAGIDGPLRQLTALADELDAGCQALVAAPTPAAADAALARIRAAESTYLPRMNSLVNLLEDEVRARVAWLERVELALLALLVLVILLEVALVFEPLRRRLARQMVELVAARARAHRALEAQDAFLSVVSHEVRTPLHGLRDALEEIHGTARTDATLAPAVRRARHASRQLSERFEQILDFSHLRGAAPPVSLSRTDLSELVHGVVQHALEHAARVGGAVLIDVDPSVPARAQLDGPKVRRCLAAVFDNALRFAGTGTVRLRAAVDEDRVVLTVKDDGGGIAPLDLDRVMEPFSLGEAYATRRLGGLGLGLPTARVLVEAMGGELRLRSDPGQGTQVTMTLPLVGPEWAPPSAALAGLRVALALCCPERAAVVARELERRGARVVPPGQDAAALMVDKQGLANLTDFQLRGWMRSIPVVAMLMPGAALPAVLEGATRVSVAAPPALWVAALAGASESLPALHGLRVLAADDNPINRTVIGRSLAALGADYDLAANGEEALERAGRTPYDVVLLDCHMPVMDGWTCARRLRDDHRYDSVPVLAVSASSRAEDLDRALAAGMDGLLGKPFGAAELERFVRLHLDLRRTGARRAERESEGQRGAAPEASAGA